MGHLPNTSKTSGCGHDSLPTHQQTTELASKEGAGRGGPCPLAALHPGREIQGLLHASALQV